MLTRLVCYLTVRENLCEFNSANFGLKLIANVQRSSLKNTRIYRSASKWDSQSSTGDSFSGKGAEAVIEAERDRPDAAERVELLIFQQSEDPCHICTRLSLLHFSFSVESITLIPTQKPTQTPLRQIYTLRDGKTFAGFGLPLWNSGSLI